VIISVFILSVVWPSMPLRLAIAFSIMASGEAWGEVEESDDNPDGVRTN
jgi:hypothetical protein